MNLRWHERDWLDTDDPAGWWYVHRDAAWLCLAGAGAVGLVLGVLLATVAAVIL